MLARVAIRIAISRFYDLYVRRRCCEAGCDGTLQPVGSLRVCNSALLFLSGVLCGHS